MPAPPARSPLRGRLLGAASSRSATRMVRARSGPRTSPLTQASASATRSTREGLSASSKTVLQRCIGAPKTGPKTYVNPLRLTLDRPHLLPWEGSR